MDENKTNVVYILTIQDGGHCEAEAYSTYDRAKTALQEVLAMAAETLTEDNVEIITKREDFFKAITTNNGEWDHNFLTLRITPSVVY